jgi:ABC-type nitrate/sulfonate/bicarbonate transport system permease component
MAGAMRWARFDPLGMLGIMAMLLIWAAMTRVLPPSSLPGPLSVGLRLGQDFFAAPELSFYGLPDASLSGSMIYTAENVLVALGVGAGLGIAAGLLTARSATLRALIDPVLMTAGTIPILVLAPFFLIWFGVGRASSVLLVALYVAVMLYVFAQRAASGLDPVFEQSARTLGADRQRILIDVLLPSTIPQILGGIRIALAGCWGLEAIAELLGAQYGVGKIIEVLAGATDVQGILAALVLLGVVAVLFDAGTALATRRLARWSVTTQIGRER